MWAFIYKLSSPKTFYELSTRYIPWFTTCAMVLLTIGFIASLDLAPADYQQGDAFRIMYIHVPAAMLSLSIYTMMTITAGIAMIWQIKLGHMVVRACAPFGASITFLALATGAIWGQPMWGTWWIWDARLTSELILLFLYMGYIALQSTIPNRLAAAKAGSVLLFVGFADIPIIHYSVNWWNTLHQGSSLSLLSKPTIAPSMLWPLLLMIGGFFVYFIAVALLRTRNEVLQWEHQSQWVKSLGR